MIKVAVVGAAGRMGQTTCHAVREAEDMELVAELDEGDAINSDTLNGAEVAVEFTTPQHTETNVHALLDFGLNVVVGTTGWTPGALERVDAHARELDRCVLVAPNFSLSAVILMMISEQFAPYFSSVEIIEAHHPYKIDSPSGTALSTAQRIAKARRTANCATMADNTVSDPLNARGADVNGVRVHALRIEGMTAHEEVVFGHPGELLTIRSDCFDRTAFMPGVLMAVRNVQRATGLTFGLDEIVRSVFPYLHYREA